MKISLVKARDLEYIIYRNLFLLTNGIIFAVVILLFVFGDNLAGIFLGIIQVANISFGLIQDIHAWSALQKLQLLTAPRVLRVREGGQEESVLAEVIQKGDRIKLKIGDQVPCDSTILEASNFEINEGLITGESNSTIRNKGEQVLAGSIVTSGFGTIAVETAFEESRIARMTEGVKKYTLNMSPIQKSVETVSKFAGYILVLVIVFVITRGILVHEVSVHIVLNVGTLADMLVPQGLIFTVTLFFAYGAANLFRKQVLLQEVNATEKLGRIKNLCMDKTGTITQNTLSVKDMLMPDGVTKEEATELSAAYIEGSGDSSQRIDAIKKFLGHTYGGKILDALPFSSWRQYGAVRLKNIKDADKESSVFVGPSEVFLPYLSDEKQKQWLNGILSAHSDTGEHLLCVMRSDTAALQDITAAKLSVVAVFVFYSDLREGIRDTIDFFQNRGVHIRIISGDNAKTAAAVAAAAGINGSDKVITGEEMKKWSAEDFEKNVKLYAIFASIVPEQKKQIVEAFRKSGFTAMIGDGANDALAVKSADLGIAMFDGAPALRQLASVVLMNNSFAALPGGVELADSLIRYIEMFASMFINQTLIGLFLFFTVSVWNLEYPLTPFNITLINYFTIGIPAILISYWIIRPTGKALPVNTGPFLERVMPFALSSAVVQSVGVAGIYALALGYFNITIPNTLVSLAFIVFGFMFFIFVPKVYQGIVTRVQKIQIATLSLCELLLLIAIFNLSPLTTFFNITAPSLSLNDILLLLLGLCPFALAQYALAKHFAPKPKKEKKEEK